jgi:hypothetical protein
MEGGSFWMGAQTKNTRGKTYHKKAWGDEPP